MRSRGIHGRIGHSLVREEELEVVWVVEGFDKDRLEVDQKGLRAARLIVMVVTTACVGEENEWSEGERKGLMCKLYRIG